MKNLGFSKKLSYFRALFPNWNFFDQIGSDFKLQFRRHSADQAWEDFPFLFEQPVRRWMPNSEIHLKLAQKNILEHFVQDLQEWQGQRTPVERNQIQNITSFKLLRSLIEVHFEQDSNAKTQFQIRILALSSQGPLELFISDWFPAKGKGLNNGT